MVAAGLGGAQAGLRFGELTFGGFQVLAEQGRHTEAGESEERVAAKDDAAEGVVVGVGVGVVGVGGGVGGLDLVAADNAPVLDLLAESAGGRVGGWLGGRRRGRGGSG